MESQLLLSKNGILPVYQTQLASISACDCEKLLKVF
jgi:hypothetical protein